ncbi:hypothetical protein FSP39_022680, partial [Pinctada imbricata]
DYTITIYLNQYWRDDRLAFNAHDNVTSMTLTGDFAEKIWVPDTFFANDKNSFLHDVTEKNKMIRLFGNGSVIYGMRFTTTLACMMDLHNYPLDVQNCTVEIESYGYDLKDLYLHWRKGKYSVHGISRVQLPQFDIVEYRTIQKIEGLLTGITTVLTMTTISNGVRSSLPRISYVKAIDIYLVMCFVFVFAALLEYAGVNYTFWGKRAKRKTRKAKEKNTTKYTASPDADDTENNSSHVPEIPTTIEEMEEVRMSPIVAIRNNQHAQLRTESEEEVTSSNTYIPRACMSGGYVPGKLIRRRQSVSLRKKKQVHKPEKKLPKFKINLPVIKDVNNIDRYSRLLFPLLFLIFNVCYWGFYLVK